MGILISALPTVDTLLNTDVFLVVRPTVGDYKGTISQLSALMSTLITSAVTQVSNSDSTLTVTPTTGAVIASLNLSHSNTWLANQTFAASGLTLIGSGGANTIFASLASSSNKTITFPNITGTVITTADTGTVSVGMLTSGIIDSLLPSETGNSGKFLTNNGSVSSWASLVTGVSSVSNSDSSITLSPTTGAVIGSINTAHQNVWSVGQRINTNISSAPAMLSGTVFQLSGADAVSTRMEINAFASQAFYSSVRWEGTKASPMALTNAVQIGGYNSFGYNGAAVVGPVVTFRAFASEDWQASPAHQGSYAEVATTQSGGATLSVVTRWENDGGITCPNTVTGGSKGPGTINVSGGYYVAGTAMPTLSSVNAWLSNQSFAASGLILAGSGASTIFASLAATTNKTITFPNLTGTVITDADTGTVSNTMLATVGLTKGGTGQSSANASLNALLPAQSTASGKYLTSDGTNTSWGTVNQTVTLTGGVTGSGSGSFAATVITNANLTGPITSIGNATSIASQTGSGTTFVMSSAPTIAGGAHTAITSFGIRSTGAAFDITLASSEVLTAGRTLSVALGDAARTLTFTSNASIGGTSSGTNTGDQTNITGNAATVTTNANLTGDVTSSGNATTLATVNSNVGTFAYGSFTVNAKGLITAASAPATPAVLTANSFAAAQTVTVTDSVTNTVTTCLTLCHDSSGTAAAPFGTGLLFNGQDSTTADQNMAAIQAYWTTATHASRASALQFQTLTAAGSLTTQMTILGSGGVGIGNISPDTRLNIQGAKLADGSLSKLVQLEDTTAYNSSPSSGISFAFKYNSAGNYVGGGGISISKVNSTDGNYSSYLSLYTRNNGGTVTEQLRIDNTGQVGIGTTSPTATLEVVSTAYPPIRCHRQVTAAAPDTAGCFECLYDKTNGAIGDSQGPTMTFAIKGSTTPAATTSIGAIGAVRDGADTSGALVFIPFISGTATERMRISSGGLVGLNTATFGTVARLTVNPNITTDNAATCQITSTTVGNKGLVVQAFSSSQTGNLFEMQKSDGTVILNMNSVLSGSSATSNFLNITGVLPSSLAAQCNAVNLQITPAGSSSQPVVALNINLASGYTGSSLTTCLNFNNSSAGTGTTPYSGSSLSNFAIIGGVNGTTTGTNVAIYGNSVNGNVNYGVYGECTTAKNSAKNIGGVFTALNTGTSPIHVGVYAGLNAGGSNPTFASAALMCDNGATTSDIFVARDNGTAKFTIIDGGNVSMTQLISTYNGVATAGLGVPAIYGSGRSTAQVAAVASVATYTVGAADASFDIAANVLVTTSSAEAFNVQVAYTDESNTARTANLNFSLVSGTLSANIAFANGAVPYMGLPLRIRCKAATTITVKTSSGGTYTGCTFNVESTITQVT